jgi:hypothetical protein
LSKALLGAQEGAGKIDVEGRAPVFQGHLCEGGVLLDPGVGDQDFDAAEPLDRHIEQTDHVGRTRHIASAAKARPPASAICRTMASAASA